MFAKAVLLGMMLAASTFPQQTEADHSAYEKQLAAVLQWEVLWEVSPAGFQSSAASPAAAAMLVTPRVVGYCSHALNTCALYKINPYKNWLREASTKCDGAESDADALTAFAAAKGEKGAETWTASIPLSGRDEIAKQYKQMHAPEVDSLQEQLKAAAAPGEGAKKITIPCYASTDPMLYYHVERAGEEPTIMAVAWNKGEHRWDISSWIESTQNAQTFERIHKTIDSVTCATLALE